MDDLCAGYSPAFVVPELQRRPSAIRKRRDTAHSKGFATFDAQTCSRSVWSAGYSPAFWTCTCSSPGRLPPCTHEFRDASPVFTLLARSTPNALADPRPGHRALDQTAPQRLAARAHPSPIGECGLHRNCRNLRQAALLRHRRKTRLAGKDVAVHEQAGWLAVGGLGGDGQPLSYCGTGKSPIR